MSDDYQKDLEAIRPFLPRGEYEFLRYFLHPMRPERAETGELIRKWRATIETMPHTYQQDGLGDKAKVFLHYFYGGSDWYITERDMSGKGTEQAFGFAVLNGDMEMAELGYISIDEITSIGGELDLWWTARELGQVRAERAR